MTFSGPVAAQSGRNVLFVTERAVLRLTAQGLELLEIAPGVDLARDIFGQMEFRPLVSPQLKLMDACIFRDEKMNLQL